MYVVFVGWSVLLQVFERACPCKRQALDTAIYGKRKTTAKYTPIF